MVEVIGRGREWNPASVRHDGGGGLHEEEGRLAVRVVAHLDRVLGIVAPDAEDTPDGKTVSVPSIGNVTGGGGEIA